MPAHTKQKIARNISKAIKKGKTASQATERAKEQADKFRKGTK